MSTTGFSSLRKRPPPLPSPLLSSHDPTHIPYPSEAPDDATDAGDVVEVEEELVEEEGVASEEDGEETVEPGDLVEEGKVGEDLAPELEVKVVEERLEGEEPREPRLDP